jgi:hypothetical protein
MKLAHLSDLHLGFRQYARLTARGLGMGAALLGAMALSAPGPKVVLRFHPKLGALSHFRTYSHYYLGGKVTSGPRPERSLTLFGNDSVVAVGGDSIVRLLEIDSTARSNGDESTGVTRLYLRTETTWTDRRAARGGIRGVSSPGVLSYLVPDVFNGTTPLPDDSVGVGDSWKAEGTYHVVEVGDTLGTLRARTQAKLKSLTVEGTDTIAVLHLKVRLDGPVWFYKEMQQTQQLLGTIEGEERFSLSRGITDSLSLSGIITTDFDLGGAGRSGVPTKITLVRVSTER